MHKWNNDQHLVESSLQDHPQIVRDLAKSEIELTRHMVRRVVPRPAQIQSECRQRIESLDLNRRTAAIQWAARGRLTHDLSVVSVLLIHRFLANLIPVNCHRASGGKKLRYVRRIWVRKRCGNGAPDEAQIDYT